MKRTALIGTLVASLAVGSAAFADGRDYDRGHGNDRGHSYDRGHDNDRGRNYDRDRRGAYQGDRRDFERRDFRPAPYARDYYRAPQRYSYGYDRYSRPRGYYEHRWTRGERLPVSYFQRSYVIDDYYGYGLYAPPRGHHWVRVDGDAVLAAVATGIVLDTIIHAFH
jgi:Ni/Co efflux regulator RcnB